MLVNRPAPAVSRHRRAMAHFGLTKYRLRVKVICLLLLPMTDWQSCIALVPWRCGYVLGQTYINEISSFPPSNLA